ncbi:hypothetical protein [Brevibacillus laterosporus]|uniref:hypothetical protein n=1 Tax=Brevibacillus laterosporus TaxID=1465 RepID=UPI00264C7800|nr:hypothetical protein [Brevibacillus laterosporus]MDN9012867.1 hypothetical protein [Brevibacillus laterosporus]MDO0943974.1 hypothetical protein [Brevibacillus laterosporus]
MKTASNQQVQSKTIFFLDKYTRAAMDDVPAIGLRLSLAGTSIPTVGREKQTICGV